MKYLIVSDIHGSFYYTKKLLEIISKEQPDKICILGDLYYHGPRNPLTEEYSPMEVNKALNSLSEKIIAIKGNCDSEIDQTISDFVLNQHYTFKFNDKTILLTHGHIYNKDIMPEFDFDIMFYGHFHKNFILKNDNKIFVNCGSISLPKENTFNSYTVLDEESITIKDIYGNIIDRLKYAV